MSYLMKYSKRKLEYIKHAAWKFNDGYVIGKTHADCFKKAQQQNIELSKNADDQGFCTSYSRFVTRKNAAKIAFEANQIDKKMDILFSEDLWCKRYNGKHNYSKTRGYILKKEFKK